MRTQFTFQPADEFVTTTPADQWLVEDVIPASGVLLIRGDNARSLFALTMAATLGSDCATWHDHPITHRPRGVAYALGDDSPRGVAYTAARNRIKAWSTYNEASVENLHVIREQIDLRDDHAVNVLIVGFLATVGKGGVLVFGNIPGDSNSGTLQRIAQQIEGLVVVCADVEPNSALAAASDSVIRIDGDGGDGRSWFVEKDFISGVPNAGGSFSISPGYAADRVDADTIHTYPEENYVYGVRQEPFGPTRFGGCTSGTRAAGPAMKRPVPACQRARKARFGRFPTQGSPIRFTGLPGPLANT
jgi:hypothetical protein